MIDIFGKFCHEARNCIVQLYLAKSLPIVLLRRQHQLARQLGSDSLWICPDRARIISQGLLNLFLLFLPGLLLRRPLLYTGWQATLYNLLGLLLEVFHRTALLYE